MACIISLERVLFSTQHIFIGAFVISSLSHRVSDCWVACASMRGTAVLRCCGKRLKAFEECKKGRTARAKNDAFQILQQKLWCQSTLVKHFVLWSKIKLYATFRGSNPCEKFLCYSRCFATRTATRSVCPVLDRIGASWCMLSWAILSLPGAYVEPICSNVPMSVGRSGASRPRNV